MYINKKIVKTSLTMNELYITCENEFTINLKDGTEYEIKIPNSKITGLIKGKRLLYFVDDFYIHDKKNNLKLFFIEIKKKKKSSVVGWFTGKNKNKDENFIPNLYEIKLLKTIGDEKEIIEKGRGIYTRNVQINNKIYWDINQEFEKWTYEPDNFILPSSSLKRKEAKLIFEKKFDKAEELLLMNDNNQKKDNKLRKK